MGNKQSKPEQQSQKFLYSLLIDNNDENSLCNKREIDSGYIPQPTSDNCCPTRIVITYKNNQTVVQQEYKTNERNEQKLHDKWKLLKEQFYLKPNIPTGEYEMMMFIDNKLVRFYQFQISFPNKAIIVLIEDVDTSIKTAIISNEIIHKKSE